MGQETQFQDLQKSMLEAVFDQTALQLALQKFAHFCGAPLSQLMVAQRNRTLLRSTFSEDLMVDLAPIEALYQDINPRVLATPSMNEGKSTRDKDFISYDQIHKDQTYQDLILPAGLGHFSGVPVIHTEQMTAGIALHRPISGDPFNDGEARRHEAASAACAPVLQMASLIESHSVRSTVELFGAGKAVAILDYRGGVLEQNDQFDQFLKSVSARIDRGRKLILRSHRAQNLLATALGNHVGIVGGGFALNSDKHADKWLCRLFPKPAFTLAGPEAGHAILVCEQINKPLLLDVKLIQEVFGLTLTEGKVAALVFQGHSTREIARARDVSLETVRSHIKSVLQKTETNRQAELVAKLARFTVHSGA